MITVNYDKCTGCGACVQKCPNKCIKWETGEFGFYYPSVDRKKCIDCGLCEIACPIEKKQIKLDYQKVFAAVHKDVDILLKSTSGGAFTALAKTVLDIGGIVYGVSMEEGFQARHIRIDNFGALNKLRGSKYLQSFIGDVYKLAEQDLEMGKLVLFTGTPCQIDGLKYFLGKNFDNLYTVDIVCHGVGSQDYFDKYMVYAKERYKNVKELRFRSKEFVGWSIGGVVLSGNSMIPYRDYDNYYYSYFLSGEIYRKSCYTCKYANVNRPGDFSLGDYWGVEALNLPLPTQDGCSLLIVNSIKGNKLLEKVESLEMIETTTDQATHCNKQLNEPSRLSVNREKRLIEYQCLSGKEIQKLYLKTHWKYVIKGILKVMMPYKLKLFVRSRRK